MDAHPPSRPWVSRRGLLRLAGAGLLGAVSYEAMRVFVFSNRHTVIPGRVYRTAQLSPGELRAYIAEKQIRTVVNLRGVCPDQDWYLNESRVTHEAGVSQEDVTLSAKRLPPPTEVRRLIDVLDHTEHPIVFHCQRGADRTGLASAVSLLLRPEYTLAAARRQLWPRYGHVAAGRTVVLDQFLDQYSAWLAARDVAHTPERFREWVDAAYVPGPYLARLAVVGPEKLEVPAGRGFTVAIRAENLSAAPWVFRPGPAGAIHLRYQLYTPVGALLYKANAGLFDRTVPPGGSIDLACGFPPVTAPGRYLIHADLCDADAIDLLDADFVQYGSEPLIVNVAVK